MASNVRLLLRLPTAIGQHMLFPQPKSKACIYSRAIISSISSRPLSITSQLSKKGGKNRKIYKNAQPQTPTPQARDLPKPQTTPARPPHVPSSIAPPPASLTTRIVPGQVPTPAPRLLSSDWMSTYFSHQDQVLLYVAPTHKAFFFSSYFVGIFLLIGGYSYAQMVLKDPPEGSSQPKVPYIMKVIGGISTLAVVTFGTAFILAPQKIIKSIMAVRAQRELAMHTRSSLTVPWKLKVEVKRIVPLSAKSKVFEVNAGQFVLDRNLPAVSQDVSFTSWDVKDAENFTQRYVAEKLEPREGSAISRFNRSLINIWPGVKREVKRMFLRDQMAYVRIEGRGNFKLDLQNCHMLDEGRVLHKMVGVDGDAKAGAAWRGFLVRLLGDRNSR